MQRASRLEVAAFAAVLLAGAALRLAHLGTPSLWWDEIVEIQTASAGSVVEVVREVKRGIPPGAGNAGAVPLDYVLLHAYLALVPRPAPAHLEAYHRVPAWLYSVAALAVLWRLARRVAGPETALLATLLLALSLPHVLYAAEARFYSLFVLVTLANLVAFARVLERPASRRVWGIYAAVAIVYFLTGLFALLVIGVQALVLTATAVRDRGRRPPIGTAVAVGGAVAVVVAIYLGGTMLGATYARPVSERLDLWGPVRQTLEFFTLGSPLLAIIAVLAMPVSLLPGGELPRSGRPFVAHLALLFLAIPAVVLLARWKHYYFHVRHVLFLLPGFVILTAIGLVRILAFLGRRSRPRLRLAAAAAIVVVAQAAAVRAFLVRPDDFFARTKTLHDMRGLARRLESETAALADGERYLLLVERQSVPNASLALYLRWWGLEQRVVLRGVSDVGDALATLRASDDGRQFLGAPFVTVAVGLTPEFRRLLDVEPPVGPWSGVVRRTGVVAYSPHAPDGLEQSSYTGLSLFERGA